MTKQPRLRLFACLLMSAALQAADLPPGVFIDIDETNTAAVAGTPSPFFTADAADPDFTAGPLWRRRAGFGFDAVGNRDIYEKNAGGGAAPLVTAVTGLVPGRTYGVHVAYLSVPGESWRVKAGLSAGELNLFTPARPAGRITDLGLSGEDRSNRHQYLGFVGNGAADSSGALRLYSDDGDGADLATRSWLEGFFLGDPVTLPAISTLPGGAVPIAPDGAWTWFNDERAIVHRGALYVGYVRTNGEYGVTRYDPSDATARHMILSTAASAQRDDHNNPSLTALPDGRLLALYSKHIAGNRFFQRTSLVPDPASDADWGEEIVRPTPAANTYANTYRLPAEHDRIYNFHRSLNFNPTLSISEDLGATWQPARQVIGTGNGRTRPYLRFASNHRDRIDAIYTDGHPRDVDNSLYHFFYADGAFRRSDGITIKDIREIPLNHDAGERGSVIYPYRAEAWGAGDGPDDWIPAGRAWTWDIHPGGDGKPVCVFQVQRDEVTGEGWANDRIFYYYARWTGAAWQRRFIAHAGRPLYAAEDDYAGGMALDPVDPRIVYISSNAADPFKLADTTKIPLRAKDRYEIWRGFTADGGLTFRWVQITVDSPADNLRPIVPENHGRTECLLWFHGSYTSYTNYSARILGRIGQPTASPSGTAFLDAPADGRASAPAGPALRHPFRR